MLREPIMKLEDVRLLMPITMGLVALAAVSKARFILDLSLVIRQKTMANYPVMLIPVGHTLRVLCWIIMV